MNILHHLHYTLLEIVKRSAACHASWTHWQGSQHHRGWALSPPSLFVMDHPGLVHTSLSFCLQNPNPKQTSQHKIRSFGVLFLVAPNRASPIGVNIHTPFLFDTSQLGHGFERYISPGALRQRKSNQKNSWSASAPSWWLASFYWGPNPLRQRLFW